MNKMNLTEDLERIFSEIRNEVFCTTGYKVSNEAIIMIMCSLHKFK